jgi:diguanylate cyclase (GGDEF)-like protein/PAS domain S-box-containing protein
MPENRPMAGIFDLLPDAVFCVDRGQMAFGEVNRAACECLGYTREELLGMGLEQICLPEDVAALARRFDDIPGDEPATAIIRTVARTKDGRTAPVEWHAVRIYQSGTERWIIVARELTDRSGKRGLSPFSTAAPPGLGMAGHDALTGLPDRRLFERRLEQALERARERSDYLFAVCFIDLDGFKAVNDRWGHLTGDRALCEIARRLVGCVRPDDVAARFGGDEFTVLIDDLRTASDAAVVARRILDYLETPLEIDGHTIKLSASIGIVTSWEPKKGTGPICRNGPEGAAHKLDLTPFSAADLLHRADQAMYRAKAMGGSQLALFEDVPPRP